MTEADVERLALARKRLGYGGAESQATTERLLALRSLRETHAAHLELSLRYELGVGLPIDSDKALFYLKKSAERNGAALMRLINEYRDGGTLVKKDTAAWMRWLNKGVGVGISGACEELADLKRAGRLARDCSDDELRELERLYTQAESYFKLGSMYCTDKYSKQCSSADFEKAREYYLKGLHSDMASRETVSKCAEVLRNWDDLDGLKGDPKRRMPLTAMELFLTPIAFVIWSIIGTFLLGVALSISAVTIPLVIGSVIIVGILEAFRRSSK